MVTEIEVELDKKTYDFVVAVARLSGMKPAEWLSKLMSVYLQNLSKILITMSDANAMIEMMPKDAM